MQVASTSHRQAPFDRITGQFVPEAEFLAHGDKDARLDALVDGVDFAPADGAEQTSIRRRSERRSGGCGILTRRRKARDSSQHRIAHRGGKVLAAHRQQLGHEEGVAIGAVVKCRGVDRDAGPFGKHSDPVDGERWHVEAPHARYGRQVAHEQGERMPRSGLVGAVCRDDQDGHAVQSPCEIAQGVQGRLVRPVEILEDQETR